MHSFFQFAMIVLVLVASYEYLIRRHKRFKLGDREPMVYPSGGFKGVQMHPPLAVSNVFLHITA